MRDQSDKPLPTELQPIAERLHGDRYEASPLELDRIKQRAMTQASSRSAGNRNKGMFMRSKVLSTVLAIGLLLASTSVGLAVTGNFPGASSGGEKASVSQKRIASASQYGGSRECRILRRDNRQDERELRRNNRRDERMVRGRLRKRLIRANRSEERQLRRRNRNDERRCRRTGTG